jgi:hypothetical protein
MIERYEIRRRIEETHCDTCGAPLLIGDKALCDDATMKAYCSEICAHAGERNAEYERSVRLIEEAACELLMQEWPPAATTSADRPNHNHTGATK